MGFGEATRYSKGALLRRLSISYSSIIGGARQPIAARGLGVHSGGFHVIAWQRNPVVAVREERGVGALIRAPFERRWDLTQI
jgi:hypothetical protein